MSTNVQINGADFTDVCRVIRRETERLKSTGMIMTEVATVLGMSQDALYKYNAVAAGKTPDRNKIDVRILRKLGAHFYRQKNVHAMKVLTSYALGLTHSQVETLEHYHLHISP